MQTERNKDGRLVVNPNEKRYYDWTDGERVLLFDSVREELLIKTPGRAAVINLRGDGDAD